MNHINAPAYPSSDAPGASGTWGARLIDQFAMQAMHALIINDGRKPAPRETDGIYTTDLRTIAEWNGIVHEAYEIAFTAMRKRVGFIKEHPVSEEECLADAERELLKGYGYSTMEEAVRAFDSQTSASTEFGLWESDEDSGDLEDLLAYWRPVP